MVESRSVDVTQLCVVRGKYVWRVYVDLTVLDCGGSLTDLLLVAAYAALADAKLPKLITLPGEVEGDFDIAVDEDPLASVPFPIDGVPVGLTFHMVAGLPIADARLEEEAVADACILVATNRCGGSHVRGCFRTRPNTTATLSPPPPRRSGQVCCVSSTGPAGIQPAALQAAIDGAVARSPQLFAAVDAACAAQAAASSHAYADWLDEGGSGEDDDEAAAGARGRGWAGAGRGLSMLAGRLQQRERVGSSGDAAGLSSTFTMLSVAAGGV